MNERDIWKNKILKKKHHNFMLDIRSHEYLDWMDAEKDTGVC